MRKVILIAVAVFFGMSCSSVKSVDAGNQAAWMYSYISAKKYRVDVVSISGSTGGMVVSGSHTSNTKNISNMVFSPGEYGVEIRGDSVISYLPYIGTASSYNYGSSQSIVFRGVSKDYKVDYGKRGRQTVSFYVNANNERYNFSMIISPDGLVGLSVKPGGKTNVSFQANIDPNYK